jgi:hypothetical protein
MTARAETTKVAITDRQLIARKARTPAGVPRPGALIVLIDRISGIGRHAATGGVDLVGGNAIQDSS